MNIGLSDKIRAVAREKYVVPALRAGKKRISIRVRDLLDDLHAEGFPPRHTPQVCSALQTAKFLRANGLEIETVEGPPKLVSPTVVVRYRVASPSSRAPRTVAGTSQPDTHQIQPANKDSDETPEEWAHRVTGKLRGLMKEELAAYGGGEAFLRWVRGYDEEEG